MIFGQPLFQALYWAMTMFGIIGSPWRTKTLFVVNVPVAMGDVVIGELDASPLFALTPMINSSTLRPSFGTGFPKNEKAWLLLSTPKTG